MHTDSSKLQDVIASLPEERQKFIKFALDEIEGQIVRIVRVDCATDYTLWLKFSNNLEGPVDISKHIEFTGTLAPLADIDFFRQVFIERGTLNWPGDINMDSTVLYHLAIGLPIEIVRSDE